MKSIKAKRLTKKFGPVVAVNSANFKILPGKVTGFLGPNGAGKTTLFNMVTGDLKPDGGILSLFDEANGKDVLLTGKKRHEIAEVGIGKLYQDNKIFDTLSVIDNIVLGMFNRKKKKPFWIFYNFNHLKSIRKEYEEKAIEILKVVGLYSEMGSDVFDKRAKELSYGQQKLLSFARLMAMDFDIFLLDEPTAGVNEFLVRKIEDLIVSMVEAQKSVAVIEHNVRVLERIADFIYFMADGSVEFFGKADHILNNDEIRKKYVGAE